MADTTEDPPILAIQQVARAPIPYRSILAAIWLAILSYGLVVLLIDIKRVLFYLTVAAFIALVLNPAVERVQRWGPSRGMSILAVLVGLIIVIGGIMAMVATPLVSQAVTFANEAPTYLQQAQEKRGPIYAWAKRLHLEDRLAKSGDALSKTLDRVPAQIVALSRRVASAAFATTIVLILALFMLAEGPRLVSTILAGIPPDYREPARRIGATTARVVAGYTTGALIIASMNGLVAGIALEATNTPFALPLATFAAAADLLPVIGGLLAIVPAALFAFAHSTVAGVVVLSAMLFYMQLRNHILYPVIVGRKVSLSSLVVMIVVLVGAELGGAAGAILAIPIAGALHGVTQEVGRHRAMVRGEPFREPAPAVHKPSRVLKVLKRLAGRGDSTKSAAR